MLSGSAGVEDCTDGGGTGDVVWEDEETVFARDYAEAVALAEAELCGYY